MKYSVRSSNLLNQKTGCAVVTVFNQSILSEPAALADEATGGIVSMALDRGDIKGDVGDVLLLPTVAGIKPDRLLLIGAGSDQSNLQLPDLRKIGASLASTLESTGASDAAISLEGLAVSGYSNVESVAALVESMEFARYRFDQLKKAPKKSKLKSVDLHCATRSAASNAKAGVARGMAVANGVRLARDLGNLPGNICTPSYLARRARKLQKSHGLKVSVLDENRMQKLGMGALLSVSRGSREPAKLIVMEHRGGPKSQDPIVLVGKGLTFDAGGISLKPAAAMDEMKYDMCGGASVFGTLQTVAELGLKMNVVGIVPSSENLPDGAANKPGDIVTSMDGQTIEILNTDAEGRLILCDALTYAKRFKPAAIIDIATLTGACVIALGAHPSGLFSKSDALAEEILNAGTHCGDRAWRMPLWDDYQKQLDSPFADIANVGGRNAGAVTAACFLARFTNDLNWAHLDIAGTAWTQGKDKSATGRPVGLLTQFILKRCE